MTQGIPSSAPSLTLKRELDQRGTLPPDAAMVLCRQLLRQLRTLHDAGITHRAIGPETVLVDALGRTTLADPEAVLLLDGADAGSCFCPPELAGAGVVRLPANIDAAREELTQAGIALDPRRIDVYQLGTLLCRVLTGGPISAYLCSPKARSRVPLPLRPLIDRALGHNPADRFTDGDTFAEALGALSQQEAAAPQAPSGECLSATSLLLPGPLCSARVASAPPDPAQPFTRLAHYRVDRLIGHGGMGDVYLGYEEALQRPVAIKVLPAAQARDEALVRRFQTEATAMARLAHPNLVAIHFIGQDAGHHFFVMQYVEGESLQSLLARKGRLALIEALGILEQCLVGLGTAHEAGLVHRDVKPGNILLEQTTGRALIADFGLVKTSGGNTATGTVLGTLDYIAPEQALTRAVDGRADLYALGVVAYQMLSGRLPFRADTAASMLFHHAYEAPTPLTEAAPGLPRPLAALVDRMMAKDPAARYQSCEEVLADLVRWRAGEPLSVAEPRREEGRAPRRRRRWLIAAAAAAFLLVAGGLALAWKYRPASTPPLDSPPVSEPSLAQLPAEQMQNQPSHPPAVVPLENGGKFPPLAPPVPLVGANITAAAFSPGATQILIADTTRLRLSDRKTQTIRDFYTGLSGPIHAATWSTDGRRVLVGGAEVGTAKKSIGVAILFDVETGSLLTTCRGHDTPVCAVALSGDGTEILTAGDAPPGNGPPRPLALNPQEFTAVRRWDARTGRQLNRYLGPTKPVRSIAFTPNRRRIFAAGSAEDPAVYSWDTESAIGLRARIPSGVHSFAALSPDASKVVIVDNDSRFIVYLVMNNHQLKELRRSAPMSRMVNGKLAAPVPQYPTWSHDGCYIAFSSHLPPDDPRRAPLYFANPVTCKVMTELPGHQTETRVLAVSGRTLHKSVHEPDFRFVFSSGKDDFLVKMLRIEPPARAANRAP